MNACASSSEESAEEMEGFLQSWSNYDCCDHEPPRERRAECERCRRPVTVCWCPFLPKERLRISTNVYILQHPFEELRRLKTAPMLYESIEEGKCHIIRGKRLGFWKRNIKYPDLVDILTHFNTVLLYPGDDAIDISELPLQADPYNLLVLDGTWSQARAMYLNNALLKTPRKVMINSNHKSKYVIRTQPTDQSLSTLECVAVALGVLEQRPELVELLTAPLVALCDFQKSHGAVEHQSKEYRISHGLWEKQLPRKLIRRQEQALQEYKLKQNEGTGQEDESRGRLKISEDNKMETKDVENEIKIVENKLPQNEQMMMSGKTSVNEERPLAKVTECDENMVVNGMKQ